VRVEVFNNTQTRQIVPSVLQGAIVRDLNSAQKRTPLRALTEGDADCTLTVVVDKEFEYLTDGYSKRVDSEHDAVFWRFHAVFNARLVGKDGRVLWSDPSRDLWQRRSVSEMRKASATPGWTDPAFRQAFFSRDFISGPASQLVYELLTK
jgi:hypothetical protein